ncbi:MAG: hypothetical protein QXZ19_03305, partial [Thermoplasmata archaeon]
MATFIAIGLAVAFLSAGAVSSYLWSAPADYGVRVNPFPKSDLEPVTESKPVTEAVANPDTFVYARIGEPDYLDPAVDYETAGGEV